MKRTTKIVIAAVTVAGLVWWARPGSPHRAARAPTPPAVAEAAPRLPPVSASPLVDDEAPPTDEEAGLVAAAAEVDLGLADPDAFRERVERTLALYRAETEYPPWSRPFDGSLPHLVDWDRGARIGQPFAADAAGREVEAHAMLDRTFAGPGEALTARVEIFRVDGGATVPVAPERLTARVENYGGDDVGWQLAGEVALAATGAGWEGRFTPATLPALAAAPQMARLVVRVELGNFFKELPLSFRYAARPALVVIGGAGDRVEQGSLAVRYLVDVQHAAPTLVQAVLYDATGETPIATYSDWFRPTRTGRQTMTVTFHGKVLRDHGLAGPYRVRGLHGHVRVPGADPEEVWWEHPDLPATLTAAYAPGAFSDQPYSSGETEAMVARYQALLDTGVPSP